MNTLIVRYTPRTGSRTARLLEHARRQVRGAVEEIDLVAEPPVMFDTLAVDAYVARNYGGASLSAAAAASLARQDRQVARMRAADVLILASPMHNFSMPGPVKTFLDGVLQKGGTWDADANGYRGLMAGKKALVLFSSGGRYDGAAMDHYTPLARTLMGFMGYDAEVVSAEGTNQDADAAVRRATDRLDALLPGWYAEASVGAEAKAEVQ